MIRLLSRAKAKKLVLISAASLTLGLLGTHIYLLDGLDGWFWTGGFQEDTVYARGYSDRGFRKVRHGMRREDVSELLGPPLGEVWSYAPEGASRAVVTFDEGHVDEVISGGGKLDTVTKGMSREEVLRLVGRPIEESLVYSRSAHDQSYRVRVVMLKRGRVRERVSEFYVD